MRKKFEMVCNGIGSVEVCSNEVMNLEVVKCAS